MMMPRGTRTAPMCPKCKNKLLYNGAGLACIACTYVWKLPGRGSAPLGWKRKSGERPKERC